jgi:AcrR family transcriptional regulator
MAEVMAEKGYVATSVEDVLKRAGVSRQSFYRLFDSKLDCFTAAFDGAGALLLERVLTAIGVSVEGVSGPGLEGGPERGPGRGLEPGLGPDADGDLPKRFERVITSYLDVLVAELPFARLFLVEVYAAGPAAVRRRGEMQGGLAALLADVLGVTDDAGRYACQVLVAATSALVTPQVAVGDADGLRAVGPPLVEHFRRLWAAGIFGDQAS